MVVPTHRRSAFAMLAVLVALGVAAGAQGAKPAAQRSCSLPPRTSDRPAARRRMT